MGRSNEAEPGKVVPVSGGTSVSVEEKLGQSSVKGVAGVISAAGQQVELDRKENSFGVTFCDLGPCMNCRLSQVPNMIGMALLCRSLSLHCFDRESQVRSSGRDVKLFNI